MILLILCYKGTNIGMMLQALATVKYLEENGIETTVLDYVPKDKSSSFFHKMRLAFKPGVIKTKMIKAKRCKMIEADPSLLEAYKIRMCGNVEYIKKYLGKIVKFTDANELRVACRNYDAVLVGSDQQWFPSAIHSDINTLMFADESVKKISYATSFGVASFPNSIKPRAKEFLSRIDHLSVREPSGAEIVKDVIGREPFVALDPTMLFDKNDWDRVLGLESVGEPKEKYIFTYFLGGNIEHRRSVMKLAEEKGLKVFAVRNLESFCKNEDNYVDEYICISSPEEFVSYLKNAEYMCTDSFHGSVFSILYHVPFFTYLRYPDKDSNSRNARIKDLLASIGAEGRLVFDKNDIISADGVQLDFEKIDGIIAERRKHSRRFLDNAVSGGDK